LNEKNRQESRRLTVKVTPNAGRNEITGWRDGALLVKVAAPPEKGKANQELVDFLSRALGVRKSAVAVVKGLTSRNKDIIIEGMSREEIENKLKSSLSTGSG
jgi:uncharacterized protein (TIGR00251 family)